MSVVKRSATLTPSTSLPGLLCFGVPSFCWSRRVPLSRHLVAGRPRHAIGRPNRARCGPVRHPWGDWASSEGGPSSIPTAVFRVSVRLADRTGPTGVLCGKHRGPGIRIPRASNQRMRAITRGLVNQRNP